MAELVEALGLAQPTVSKHLRVLRDAGFVSCRTAAQQRIYRLEPGPMRLRRTSGWRPTAASGSTTSTRSNATSTTSRSTHDAPRLRPGPLAAVHAIADGERWTLVFARDLSHPPAAVWRSLTDPAELTAWSPFVADRDLGTPGPVTLTMIDGDERQDLPGRSPAATHRPSSSTPWGDDVLRWELERTEGAAPASPSATPWPTASGCPRTAAGWHLCLVVADRLLAGDPIPRSGARRRCYGWSDLDEAYTAVLLR